MKKHLTRGLTVVGLSALLSCGVDRLPSSQNEPVSTRADAQYSAAAGSDARVSSHTKDAGVNDADATVLDAGTLDAYVGHPFDASTPDTLPLDARVSDAHVSADAFVPNIISTFDASSGDNSFVPDASIHHEAGSLEQILYLATQDSSDTYMVNVINADGTNQREVHSLAKDNYSDITVQWCGNQILASGRSMGNAQPTRYYLTLLNPDTSYTSSLQMVDDEQISYEPVYSMGAFCSPGADRIFFNVNNRHTGLYILMPIEINLDNPQSVSFGSGISLVDNLTNPTHVSFCSEDVFAYRKGAPEVEYESLCTHNLTSGVELCRPLELLRQEDVGDFFCFNGGNSIIYTRVFDFLAGNGIEKKIDELQVIFPGTGANTQQITDFTKISFIY